MTETTQYDRLKAEFPDAAVENVQGFDYIAIHFVTMRLNDVLGVGGWSTEIKNQFTQDGWVITHVRLTAKIDGKEVFSEATSGARIVGKNLGNNYKGSTSAAIKKAAQKFGVGLYLAGDEDLAAIKEEGSGAAAPKLEALPGYAMSDEGWGWFVDALGEMSTEQVAKVASKASDVGAGKARESYNEEQWTAVASFVSELVKESAFDMVAEVLGGEVVEG